MFFQLYFLLIICLSSLRYCCFVPCSSSCLKTPQNWDEFNPSLLSISILPRRTIDCWGWETTIEYLPWTNFVWYWTTCSSTEAPTVSRIKFIYSEKATKFCGISTLILSYVVPVKSKVEISKILMAFSEYMNLTIYQYEV